MIKTRVWVPVMTTIALSMAAGNAMAKVSEAEAAKLGKELTCVGAEAGANADGSIPAFSGKWLGKPSHVEYTPHVGQHPVDVYPEDKPLFEITAANVDKYADKLSEGQKAMFKRFPETFRMQVYQTRRDFRYPDVICEVAKKNALEAELIDGGLGYTGYKGPIGFPIPKEPMEVLESALRNVGPVVEVKPRRVGGATNQVPVEVSPDRRASLAMRWIIAAARSRSGKSMTDKLSGELATVVCSRFCFLCYWR